MKHLQADLSTYTRRPKPYHPRDNPLRSLVYTYYNSKVTSKWTSTTEYFRTYSSLSNFTPIDAQRAYYDFNYFYSITLHTVVTINKLEAWTAYFLEHPSDTSHLMYKQCLNAFPEYFL